MEGGQIFETTKGIKGAKIQTTLIYMEVGLGAIECLLRILRAGQTQFKIFFRLANHMQIRI